MTKIKDGKITEKEVIVGTYSSIEHGNLKKVTSIVLHRTDSSKAKSTLDAYAGKQKTGAHFLIDVNGDIYQTANLNKTCWHVGQIIPRCLNSDPGCDKNELKTIAALSHEKGLSFSKRMNNLSKHESEKEYPLRYPSNADSIGIEVVGKSLPAKKTFEVPTSGQLKSLKWLVNILVEEYNISLSKDVFAHGAIARKEASEGAQILQFLLAP